MLHVASDMLHLACCMLQAIAKPRKYFGLNKPSEMDSIIQQVKEELAGVYPATSAPGFGSHNLMRAHPPRSPPFQLHSVSLVAHSTVSHATCYPAMLYAMRRGIPCGTVFRARRTPG